MGLGNVDDGIFHVHQDSNRRSITDLHIGGIVESQSILKVDTVAVIGADRLEGAIRLKYIDQIGTGHNTVGNSTITDQSKISERVEVRCPGVRYEGVDKSHQVADRNARMVVERHFRGAV